MGGASEERPSAISAAGEGIAYVAPDVARFNIGVSLVRVTAQEAAADAAKAAQDLIAVLEEQGVDQDDIQTAQYSVGPEWSYSENEPEITGYRVGNLLRVTIRDLEKVGGVIDQAVTTAGDAAQIQGITFEREDDADARSQAREAAFRQARAVAEELSALAGVDLGAPLSIEEQTSTVAPPREAHEAVGGGSTPVQPGVTTTIVRVAVEYGIR